MQKTQLQELCQSRRWQLPEYSTTKEGPDHDLRFQSTVTVNGLFFHSPSPARSAKEAQNEAAKLAVVHLSATSASASFSSSPIRSPPAFASSSSGFSGAGTELNCNQSIGGPLQVKQQSKAPLGGSLQAEKQQNQDPPRNATSVVTQNDDNIRANEPAYKNLLQELIHKKGCKLPYYSTSRISKFHMPAFVSTVEVEGEFFTGQEARTKKQAEMNAAKVAYTALTQHTLQVNVHEIGQSLHGKESSVAGKDVDKLGEEHLLYKNLLQNYAQKRNLSLPVYSWASVGPSHAIHFKCNVTIDGQTYESQGIFPTLVEAEHAAAKAALMSLSPNEIEEDESGYKNLLQEMAQKNGNPLPIYHTHKSGQPHQPTFVSTVEVEGQVFAGLEARTKKQAELSAAKSAYKALKQRNPSQGPGSLLSASQHGTLPLTSMSQSDLVAYLDQNFQPKMPLPNQQIEDDRGVANSSATFNASLSSGSPNPPHINGLSLSPSCSEASPNVAKHSSGEGFVLANTSCRTKVFVHPRKTKMTYPQNSTILPMTDENWIAIKIVPQSNSSD